jgi:hypothetical protein
MEDQGTHQIGGRYVSQRGSMSMADDTELERRIRERAFEIWLDEGCPDGRDKAHWERARREISESDPSQHDAPPLQPEPIGEVKYAEERLADGGEGRPPSEER